MSREPVTGRKNLCLDPLGGVLVVFRNDPPNGIKVVAGLGR
jgi:hypothetical protein